MLLSGHWSEGWRAGRWSGSVVLFTVQLEIKKKEQRGLFTKYVLLYSDKVHFRHFMRLMSPAPDYKYLIGILIRL